MINIIIFSKVFAKIMSFEVSFITTLSYYHYVLVPWKAQKVRREILFYQKLF